MRKLVFLLLSVCLINASLTNTAVANPCPDLDTPGAYINAAARIEGPTSVDDYPCDFLGVGQVSVVPSTECEPYQDSVSAKAMNRVVTAEGTASHWTHTTSANIVAKCPFNFPQSPACTDSGCTCQGTVWGSLRRTCTFTNPVPSITWNLESRVTADLFHDAPFGNAFYDFFWEIGYETPVPDIQSVTRTFSIGCSGGVGVEKRDSGTLTTPLVAGETLVMLLDVYSDAWLGAFTTETTYELLLTGPGTPGCSESTPELCVVLECVPPMGTRAPIVFSELDVDGDGVPNSVDNAVTQFNPDQADLDGDGLADVIDDCPTVPGSGFGDSDGDGWEDPCDCLPDDPSAFQDPIEIQTVRISGGPDYNLSWDSTHSRTGNGTRYDVLRGAVGELPVGLGLSDYCVVSATGCIVYEDREIPIPGDGWWYLVRGTNNCTAGSYGEDSNNNERFSSACP